MFEYEARGVKVEVNKTCNHLNDEMTSVNESWTRYVSKVCLVEVSV